MGLTRADFAADETHTEVWPDCWLAVGIFTDMSTQWRVGLSGPVGLDYSALTHVMRLRRVPAGERSALFDDIQIMEQEVLAMNREKD